MAFKMSGSGTFKGPKTTPVFLLLDVSGSMYGEKIDTLNEAVDTMLKTLAADEMPYLICAITFGNEVKTFIQPCDAKEAAAKWRNMDADGMTPMGAALRMGKELIENDNVIKGRTYYPVVVLVSDGGPNDAWKTPLADFLNTGRSSKCQRMAMGIGADCDMDVLKQFTRGMDEEKALFKAADAGDIKDFFERVTRVSQEQSQGASSLYSKDNVEDKHGTNLYHGDVPPGASSKDDSDEY